MRRRVVDPARAVAYLRVSTEEQSLGPEAQRAAIEAWATRERVEIVAWYSDEVSGAAALEDRPGLVDAITALREQRAGLMVAAKRDRFARDRLTIAMIERDVERIGARLRTADGTNDDSPEAVLMRQILDAFAVYERAMIRARTRAALRAKRARGERAGAVPFGFDLDPDLSCVSRKSGRPQKLRPNPTEQATLSEMARLRGDGLTTEAIAIELNRQHRPCRCGKWSQSKVWKLLAARVGSTAA